MEVEHTIEEAARLHDTGQTDAAIKLLSEAIVSAPNDQLYYKRGRLFTFLNDVKAADSDYSNAIKLESSEFKYWISRGRLRFDCLYIEGARGDFTVAAMLDPTSAIPHQCLSLLYLYSKAHDKAISYAQKAVSINSSDPWSWRCLGRGYYAKGDFQAAADAFRRAVDIDESAASWIDLAESYVQMNRLREAMECYEKAIEVDYSVTPLLGLAQVMLELGKPDEAIRYLDLARTCTPTDFEKHTIEFYFHKAKHVLGN